MLQGLCVFDAQEQLLFLNPRYTELLGIEGSGIGPGWTFADQLRVMHSADAGTPEQMEAGVQEERERHLAQVKVGHRSLESVHRGRTLVVHHRALPGGGWVTTLADVTERRTIERRIVHMAQHDALTELPNRAAFHDLLSRYLAGGNECALLYIDLDRFKPVNDSLGHAAGDEVLRLVAERIREELRMDDISARLGGDEFAVLLPETGSLAWRWRLPRVSLQRSPGPCRFEKLRRRSGRALAWLLRRYMGRVRTCCCAAPTWLFMRRRRKGVDANGSMRSEWSVLCGSGASSKAICGGRSLQVSFPWCINR